MKSKKVFLALSLCAGLCVSAGAIGLAGVEASAEASYDFHCADGASVRLADNMGIRFEAFLDQDTYDAVASGEATFGMIIVSAENYAAAGGNYHTTLQGKKYREFTYTAEQFATNNGQTETDTEAYPYAARAAIVDMLFNNVDQQLVAISYVKDGDTYIYEASEARTIAQVSEAALEAYDETQDPYKNWTETHLAFLEEIGQKAYAKKAGMTFDGTNYVYAGETYTQENWKTPFENILTVSAPEALNLKKVVLNEGEISSATIEASVESFGKATDEQIVWTTDDADVATVVNGTVQATGVGATTVHVAYGEQKVSVEVYVTKAERDAAVSLGDLDISAGEYTFSLAQIDEDAEYEGSVLVTEGETVYESTYANGEITLTGLNAETIRWGERTLSIEFDDYIVNGVSALAVTKIIKTATDLLSMETLAGGRDATTDAYEGYFVLGNSIDLGSTKVSAKQDGNAHQRDITRGFQGVFDGRGHVIANGIYDTGLFGTVGGEGKVVNLAIYNAVLAPSSNGTGIFGYKYFGLLENVSISCTHASAFDNAGTIAYTAYGATFRNVVVETDYVWSRMSSRNNHGAFIAFNATSGHGNSPTGLINTYENVYVITNRLHKGKISVFDEVNTQKYEQKGNGLITYLENAENMSFTGLNSEYWTGEGVPYFKTVDSELTASYTVKHFVRNDTTGLVERETETKRAMVGSVITSYGRGYEDRKLADPNKDSNLTQLFPSGKAGLHTGTVTADNALVLECYYTMRDQYLVSHSTSNKAYVMDMRGNPRTGAQVVDYLGTYEGVDGAYRMTSPANSDSRIAFRNTIISLSDLQKDYKYFEVKIYSTNFATVDVIPQPASGSGYNVSDLANDSCMELYDETGTTRLTQTPTSGWVTMRFICSNLGNATYFLQIGLKGSGTSYCFAQPTLVK